VRSHRSYAEGSNLIVVGEAVNGGAAPVYNLKVIATFYDAGGQLVGAQETLALLRQTQPTQANPFKLQLANASSNIDRYEFSLIWDEISIAEFERVTITREEVHKDDGLEISGELRNDGRPEVRNLLVAATFYDDSGAVLEVAPGSAAVTTLAPGATTTFSVRVAQEIPYASYLVQTEGMIFR
jgi:hypothetical protein